MSPVIHKIAEIRCPDQLLPGDTGQRFACGIDIQHRAVPVENNHEIRVCLDHRSRIAEGVLHVLLGMHSLGNLVFERPGSFPNNLFKVLVYPGQFSFGFLEMGDVPDGLDSTDNVPLRIEQGGGDKGQDDFSAVG